MEAAKIGWKRFIHMCQSMPDDKTLDDFFNFILTAEEKENLSMRCLIIDELLKEELPQREIAKKLQVSISKITRGSNEIKRHKPSFIAYLKSLLSK